MRAIFFVRMAALTIFFGMHCAWAGTSYSNTAAGGDWGTAASWVPNTGTPGAGDTIALSAAGTITVSSNQQFGATSGSSNSSWTTFSTIAMTGGSVLTHNASDKFSYSQGGTGNFIMSGSGTFLNLGNLQNDGSYARLLGLRSGLTLENQGTLTFNGGYTSMNVDGTSKLFNNDGTISVTASNQGYIGSTGAGAQFTTYDSGSSTLKGLAVAIGNSAKLGLGYYFNDLSQTLSGTVKISSLSMGNSSSTLEFGNVDMTLSTSATNTLTGAGILNVGSIAGSTASKSTLTLGGNQTWDFAGGVHVASSSTGTTLKLGGNTLTIARDLTTSGGSNVFLDGGTGGKLILQGTTQINQGFRGINVANGGTVENQGTLSLMNANNMSGVALDGTSTLFNNGGTISASKTGGIGASADGGVFTNYDTSSSSYKDLTVNVTGNSTLSLGTNINGTYQPMNGRLDGKVKFTSLTVDAGSTLQIGRYSNLTFQGSYTANGGLKLESNSAFNLDGNFTANFGQGMLADTATITTNGHTLTLQGTANVFGSGNTTTVVASGATGYLLNQGTLSIGAAAGTQYRGLTVTQGSGGVGFQNDGTVAIRVSDYSGANQSALTIDTATKFLNSAGALFVRTVNNASGPNQATVLGTNATTSVFDNQGIVQSTVGTLIFSNVAIPQISGTTLTGGTWKATGSGAALTLPTAGGNIQTIGNGAAVYLENGGTINTINAALTTVNGTFVVNGTSTFTDASGFSVGTTGTVGGTGTIQATVTANGAVSPGNSAGTLTVSALTASPTASFEIELGGRTAGSQYDVLAVTNALDLGGAALTISFIDGFGSSVLPTDVFTIMSAGTLTGTFGNLVDNLVFVGTGPERFTVMIDTDTNQIRLSNFTIPEPATLVLVGFGGLGLLARRRRRKG